ncbi:TIGR00296 family protein [Methanoplanus endosymbiosus]|uniref:Protein L6E24_10840 n=1 Tax=Methanoplanus endosymbiosus TaxID=33865 RepID=A0A9E7PNB3_9EURY|nr:TIGR00296 family protein [Methanoplanus endosymbiosus]UUX91851.1 TIGR00296 family protein [Methanoplanus endosymbiosus]
MELLDEDEGKTALCIARSVINEVVSGKKSTFPELTPVFNDKRGVFVTLNKYGDLRGCIGIPYPVMPLKDALREAAASSATADPRFERLKPDELSEVTIDITVLTPPETVSGDPLKRPEKIEVGKHGLIISGFGRSGLLLPQVATEYEWDAEEFLDHTCRKAGFIPGFWKNPEIELKRFEGQIFSEIGVI